MDTDERLPVAGAPGANPISTDATYRAPQLGFGVLLLLLLMVVAAGVGLLLLNALRVPMIASELNAWRGLPSAAPGGSDEGRAAHLTFLLFVYSAPVMLGILVNVVHSVIGWLDRRARGTRDVSDFERNEFR